MLKLPSSNAHAEPCSSSKQSQSLPERHRCPMLAQKKTLLCTPPSTVANPIGNHFHSFAPCHHQFQSSPIAFARPTKCKKLRRSSAERLTRRLKTKKDRASPSRNSLNCRKLKANESQATCAAAQDQQGPSQPFAELRSHESRDPKPVAGQS